MRAVIQRVASASVTVDGEVVGAIDEGLLVLLGVAPTDGSADAVALVDKMLALRVFSDDAGKMNRSGGEVGGSLLVVSQFTLLADVRKGRRPSFTAAAPPGHAAAVIDEVVRLIADRAVTVATGSFGALMEVDLVNAGPVTIVIDVADGRIQ